MSLNNVKHIVLVLSGKGGVGKSSVTTQLALSLSLQGHNVGILDVDLTGPSIPRLLGIENEKVKQAAGGWQPVQVHEAQQIQKSSSLSSSPSPIDARGSRQVESNGAFQLLADVTTNDKSATALSSPEVMFDKVGSLQAMSLAFLLSSRSTAIVWRGPKKTAMIRQFLSTVAWPEGTDYLLIDTPPGTSDEHISLIESLLKEIGGSDEILNENSIRMTDGSRAVGRPNLAGAVIVTTPQAVAVSDVRKELNFCAKTGVKVIGVIENMSGYVCPCCGEAANLFSKGGGQVMAAEFNVPFLGSIPVDPLWGLLVEEGKRPKYEQQVADAMATKQEDEMEEQDEGADTNSGVIEDGSRIREEGLLVDKYRDCSLYSAFKDIAQGVSQRTEENSAVIVSGI